MNALSIILAAALLASCSGIGQTSGTGSAGESMGALALTLDDADLARIEAAIRPDAAAGARYPTASMAHLDSEQATSR